MSVFVTGGSGVVGRAVVRLLVAEGRQVRGLARSDQAAGILESLGAEAVRGDILDYDSVVEAMAGAGVAYHVAGVNAMCALDPEPMRRANVDGTRNVIRAAAANRIRRVVYTSSAVTIGEARGSIGREDSPHRGWFLSAYERTKYEAEHVALGERLGVPVIAVNPSSVQGPGRATGTGRLLLAILRGRLPFVVDTRLSIVDIADCARGHLLAERHGVPGERYLLSGFTATIFEAVALLSEATGRRLDVRTVPAGIVVAGGAVAEALGRLRRRPPGFCREMARVLTFGHTYDGTRAAVELGLAYTPAIETIRRTIAWFRDEGLLPAR